MQNNPLPSWNDGPHKQAILDFVAVVTEEGSDQFVPEGGRIAAFDNDGTLWVEQPMYSQGFFALESIHTLAPGHPEWQSEQPFAAVPAGDRAAMSAFSEHDIASILAASHAGMTPDQFYALATGWLNMAKRPRYGRLFTDCVHQPQLELLNFLRENRFRTYIVSGGGIALLRRFAAETYGIPPNQVVGSSGQVTYALVDGVATLTKEAKIGAIDDKDGKLVNIHLHLGPKTILAFGNSDGDQAILEYTDCGDGLRLMLIVHHDDAEREYTYEKGSHVGKLNTALTKAAEQDWIVVSMKNDWNTIFPDAA